MRVGLISDTHGLLRPQAVAQLTGCDHILHAGDIGSADILDALRALAPVTAIRGNNDHGPWAEQLREVATVELGGRRIRLLHDRKALRELPAVDVLVVGHSHRPLVERSGDLLIVNPGSAGPRRFSLPVSVAELRIGPTGIDVRLIRLDDGPPL